MVALVVALVSVPVAAGAQDTNDRIASTRAAIDDAASRWFDSKEEVAKLDADIAQLEREIIDTKQRAATTAAAAQARALAIYKGSGTDLGPIFASDDALDTVRRAELLDRANADSERVIEEFNIASETLEDQSEALEERKSEQASLVEKLADEQADLERQLAELQAQAQREAAAAAAAAAEAAAERARQEQAAAAARAAAAPKPAGTKAPAPAAPKPAATKPAKPPSQPVDTPAPPPPSGGTHPHHDDPWMVCTRARESGGNYGVVSSSGLYYGAYQFMTTTWNATASRAGRPELIGVRPNQASAYDQDDMAWTLYQWQGKGPWGGRC